MTRRGRLRTGVLGGAIALLAWALPSDRAESDHDDASCADVAARGYLNVLTINLLYSEIRTRGARLGAIADFVAEHGVDVVLLQEVAGGVLVRTADSARDLQRRLHRRAVGAFELRTAVEFGAPRVLTVANATLSRCAVLSDAVGVLPAKPEVLIGRATILLPRNVLMTRIDIPEFGQIDVYNTHLCSFCGSGQRGTQLDGLLGFVGEAESSRPDGAPVVLGGDFNLTVFEGGGAELYRDIVDPARPGGGFVDAYAAARTKDPDDLCNPGNEPFPDEHCTDGVTPLGSPEDIGRIDYIFVRNFGPVLDGAVVFNPLIDPTEPTVSDHAGVLVSVALPAEEFPVATVADGDPDPAAERAPAGQTEGR